MQTAACFHLLKSNYRRAGYDLRFRVCPCRAVNSKCLIFEPDIRGQTKRSGLPCGSREYILPFSPPSLPRLLAILWSGLERVQNMRGSFVRSSMDGRSRSLRRLCQHSSAADTSNFLSLGKRSGAERRWMIVQCANERTNERAEEKSE